MKYSILLVCLLFSCNLYAQQSKAYELVHYVAKRDGYIYLLDYADGYPGASSVKIKRSKRIIFTLQPVNAAADNNGDLLFTASKSKQAGQLVLQGIDENSTAPAMLKAAYALNGRRLMLTFIKKE